MIGIEINIRLAREEDYDSVEILMKQIQRLHMELRPDIFIEVNPVLQKEIFLNHLRNNNDYVAENNGEIVGYVSLVFVHKEYPSITSRNVVCVNTLVVKEGYRGKGVGSQLMTFVDKLKTEIHFDKIELSAWYANKEALSFYNKKGMIPQTVTFEY